jgi:aminoglycoside phosphotransferase
MNKLESIAKHLDCGNLFATRETIDQAFEYVDAVSGSLCAADKVAMLTAVAVLCNTIRDQLRDVHAVPTVTCDGDFGVTRGARIS